MAKRLTDEERARRAQERAEARERKRKEKAEAKARKDAERAAAKAKKAEEKAKKAAENAGKKRKGLASWIYWKIREQRAKARESANHLDAGKTALRIAARIREAQARLKGFLAPLLDAAAKLKTPEARLIWSKEPWTHQERTRYNWGKRQDIWESIQNNPDGETQDPEKARADAKRKTRLREIDHAKAIERSIDYVMAELAEDETNILRSSLERSYEKVRADIAKEIEDERRAIDADKADETRIADLKDLTRGGKPRRTAPETRMPQNAPRLGNYGESVILGQPSPDQVKAAINLEYEGKDFAKRIWGDTEKLARELKDIMQSAIINGEGAEETARKLAQRMGVHFSHCLRLVRTEFNRVMNQAQLDQMRDADVKYYIFKAIHDSRTCGHCTRLDGKRVKIEAVKTGINCPPIHPSCRCTIIPDFGNGNGGGGDGNGGPDTSWISDLFRKHLGEDAEAAARDAQAETETASASSAQTAPEKAPQASNATVATASSAQTTAVATASSAQTSNAAVATASSADARPPEPKGKDRKKKAEGAGVQRTIEQYLKELEAREAKDKKQAQDIEKATQKARNLPTAENIEKVAELQDAAMLAEEQAQQEEINRAKNRFAVESIKVGETIRERRARQREEAALKKELEAQTKAKEAEYRRAEEAEKHRLEQKREASKAENVQNEKEIRERIIKEDDALKDQLKTRNEALKGQCETELARMRPEWARQQQEHEDRTKKMEGLIESHPDKVTFQNEIQAAQDDLKNQWNADDRSEQFREQKAQIKTLHDAQIKADKDAERDRRNKEREEQREARETEEEEQEEAERARRRLERDETIRKRSKVRPRARTRGNTDGRRHIINEAKEAQKRLAQEHENTIKDMNEDAESAIKKDRRKSQRRIRIMKAKAEIDKREAKQKADAERDAILAAASKEMATAQKAIERARKMREETKDAISKIGGIIAKNWAQTKTNEGKLNLASNGYRHQAEAFKTLLQKIIDEDNYEAKRRAIREYAEALRIGDRADAILNVLTEKILNRTIPPYYFADQNSGQSNYIAYQEKGGIRICLDATDWSGHATTIYHETGHYLDQTILKRKYAGRIITEDPNDIQRAFEDDKRTLNRRGTPIIFKIGNFLFSKEEFRAQNNGRGYSRLSSRTYVKLKLAIADKLGVDMNDARVEEYLSQIADAIQSVLGWNYGDGHKSEYVRERLGTYKEAIAQITSAIAGHDFLSDIFPNAYRKIKEIYEED